MNRGEGDLHPFGETPDCELYDYIEAQASTRIAERFISRIVEFCFGLTLFPLRGASHDEILPGLRTVGFDRRVTIAFMILPEQVVIEGVFYGGQDFAARLRRDD
jgi:plasmid stabilization system protein ParE